MISDRHLPRVIHFSLSKPRVSLLLFTLLLTSNVFIMGLSISSLFSSLSSLVRWSKDQDVRILMLGLDSAGKVRYFNSVSYDWLILNWRQTTILYRLQVLRLCQWYGDKLLMDGISRLGRLFQQFQVRLPGCLCSDFGH